MGLEANEYVEVTNNKFIPFFFFFLVLNNFQVLSELGCCALVTAPLLVSQLLFSVCALLWCSIMCSFPFVSIVHACESFFLPQAPLFFLVPFL